MCADYDQSTIGVAPNDLKNKSTEIVALVEQISGALARMNETLEALQLQWQGQSAAAQKDITDEWTRVFGELFGTQDKPEDGVLNALADHVTNAAKNYAEAEKSANEIFGNLLVSMVKQDLSESIAETFSGLSLTPDQKYQEIMNELMGESEPATDQKDPTQSAVFTDYPDA